VTRAVAVPLLPVVSMTGSFRAGPGLVDPVGVCAVAGRFACQP
jgi:hypothetical protein